LNAPSVLDFEKTKNLVTTFVTTVLTKVPCLIAADTNLIIAQNTYTRAICVFFVPPLLIC
jgi:hypothetical protein